MHVAESHSSNLRCGDLCLVHLVCFRAFGADATHQALGQHQVERRGDVERLDTHVHQTSNRLGSRVGVQGREDEVTGEGGLDGDATRLQVSNFSQHDDVGVLTKKRLQRGGEGHPDLGSHQHLVDAEQVVFDRVLRRHDVDVDVVDLR